MPPDPEEGSPKRLHEERMNLPGLSYYQEFPSSEVVGFLKRFELFMIEVVLFCSQNVRNLRRMLMQRFYLGHDHDMSPTSVCEGAYELDR